MKISPGSIPIRSPAARPQLDRGTSCSKPIVTLCLGRAEHADETVAEIQLDAPAVPLDHLGAPVEDTVKRLGIRDRRTHGENGHDAARIRPARRAPRPAVPVHGRERVGHGQRRRALLRWLGQKLENQPLQGRRAARRRGGRRRQMLGEHARGLGCREWRTSRHEFVERGAERVHVARGFGLAALDLLRGEVADRAEDKPSAVSRSPPSSWAMPKSPSAALPSAASHTLPGLTSRCTTP